MTMQDLNLLARDLELSDPEDRGAQKKGLDRLNKLRQQARADNAVELATCLGAIVQLIEALAGTNESISRDQIQGMACRMLFALGSDLRGLTMSLPNPRRPIPVSTLI